MLEKDLRKASGPYRAKALERAAWLQTQMSAEADRGRELLARDPRVSREDAIRYEELRKRFDGTQRMSVLDAVRIHTGLSFPRVKDERGEVLDGERLRRHPGSFLLSKQLEGARWRASVLDHEQTEEGVLDTTFHIRIEPKTGERFPNPSDVVFISHFGNGLQIQRGESVLYNGRLSYAELPFGQINDAIAASFARPENNLDRRHREFMGRAQEGR